MLQSDVERELSNMFPISGADDGDSVGSDDLDRLVSELSASLMDDVPTVDPRWAESRRSGQCCVVLLPSVCKLHVFSVATAAVALFSVCLGCVCVSRSSLITLTTSFNNAVHYG